MDILFVVAGVGIICGVAVGWGLVVGSATELFRDW